MIRGSFPGLHRRGAGADGHPLLASVPDGHSDDGGTAIEARTAQLESA